VGRLIANIPTYVRLEPNGPLPDLREYAPFKSVIVIEGTYSPEWQDKVSRWLVDSGCRYMLAWGSDCSSWDDSVDYAVIMKHPGETPDEEFVVTTWHNDDTLEEVFWQAQFNAQFSYDDVELTNALIVHISDIDREEWMKALFERSKILAQQEPD
jgi:hypothetical protein